MKRILITGEDSYIGISLEKWLLKETGKYEVETISVIGDEWKKRRFSEFDAIVHVAGIAHIKETKENQNLYYEVNRDLAYEIANKAKEENVKQFIFFSSMSVYGVETGIIDKNTPLTPKSNYGKSKLQAEELIKPLEDDAFKVAILRPPMIYGKGCKGNYPKLANLAIKVPIFPEINNKRSMIYIDNLSEFVKLLIDNYSSGLFFPQNSEYVNTSHMVNLIAKSHGKTLKMTKLFNLFLKFVNVGTVNKVFGDLIYKKDMSLYKQLPDRSFVNFEDSIKMTEE